MHDSPFAPRVVLCALVIFIGGITLLCKLGFWQLSRAEYKQALHEQREKAQSRGGLTAQDLLSLPSSNLKAWQFQPVLLKGSYLNQYTILLDNKTNNGQAGYHVIVPVALNENTLILVDRGWIPLGPSRAILPQPKPVIGEVTIEGYLDFEYRNVFLS